MDAMLQNHMRCENRRKSRFKGPPVTKHSAILNNDQLQKYQQITNNCVDSRVALRKPFVDLQKEELWRSGHFSVFEVGIQG